MSNTVKPEINDLAFHDFHFVKLMFYPSAWKQAIHSSHTWEVTDFPPIPKNVIPKKPGVYIFVVQPEIFDFIHSSGLFYVGKATNLYERISAYISEINKDQLASKRPLVWRMVNQWNGHLKYHYTTTKEVSEAESLEDEMLKAFTPPFNKQYPAEISARMRAFL